MKAVVHYIAEDGSSWSTPEQALDREVLCQTVRVVMAELPERPADTNYENGDGYLQHNSETVLWVRGILLDMAISRLPSSTDRLERLKDPTYDLSLVLRIFDGSCPPLEAAFRRLYCIDQQHREWGQPYFALNPGRGQEVRLNR